MKRDSLQVSELLREHVEPKFCCLSLGVVTMVQLSLDSRIFLGSWKAFPAVKDGQ